MVMLKMKVVVIIKKVKKANKMKLNSFQWREFANFKSYQMCPSL